MERIGSRFGETVNMHRAFRTFEPCTLSLAAAIGITGRIAARVP